MTLVSSPVNEGGPDGPIGLFVSQPTAQAGTDSSPLRPALASQDPGGGVRDVERGSPFRDCWAWNAASSLTQYLLIES